MILLSLPDLKVKNKYQNNSGSFTCGLVDNKVVYGFTDKTSLIVFDKETASVICVLSIKQKINAVGVLTCDGQTPGVLAYSEA